MNFYSLSDENPHNYRAVGISMFMVAFSLATIGILSLFVADDVLYGDSIKRQKVLEFENCKAVDFVSESCVKFKNGIQFSQCLKNNDLESPECFTYRTWVESKIFEECRSNRDNTSPECKQFGNRVFANLMPDKET